MEGILTRREKTEVEDSGEEGKGGTGTPEDKRRGTGRAEPPLEMSEQIGQARVKAQGGIGGRDD